VEFLCEYLHNTIIPKWSKTPLARVEKIWEKRNIKKSLISPEAILPYASSPWIQI
jgi:hypothetical protein